MRIVLTLFFIVFSISFHAQSDKNILFTVDDEPVHSSEFLRVYNKNLDLVKDESQKNIDEYLKLFIDYKLKLKEAKSLGLDKDEKYIRELSSYKKQLAKNYLMNNKVTNELVEEAYERMNFEVNASHILIRIDEFASAEDTLVAYNKLLEFKSRVLNEGYKDVQKDVHNGKTILAEDLNYFSAFKMVYDFENAAFNTPPGEVSNPFRTQFGYHIIVVHDKRKSKGQREVAHIMVSFGEGDEQRIQDIHKKIKQGESFESLAKQFSEDKSSANKGGILTPFSSGELRSLVFENQAFALENNDDYSEPFKSEFGWHIIKLINKIELGSLQDMRSTIESKVKRDSRSKLINTSRINELKERYAISNVEADLDYFVSILNDDYFKRKWNVPDNFESDKPFVKIDEKQFTYGKFSDFLIQTQQRTKKALDYRAFMDEKYNVFLETMLVQYQEENLENENKEFSYILSEYRDGLLLFELMENEIWKAASNDSIGVQGFYNLNKEKYYYEERIDAVVASSADRNIINEVSELLRQDESTDKIKEQINVNDEVNVIFTNAKMNANHQAIPKSLKFVKGISDVMEHNDSFIVVKVNEVLPKTLKTFEEAKGKVISDFQDNKEKNWLIELSNKYNVQINQDEFERLKSKLVN